MRNAIFLSFDDNYAHFAKSCINSIVSNYSNYPDILASYSGKNQNILDFLNNVKNLKIIHLKSSHAYQLGPVVNQIVFDRFELWNEFEPDYDNILHLDVDTIVLKNLDHLFSENAFYAVSDTNQFTRVLKIHDRSLHHSAADRAPGKITKYIYQDGLQDLGEKDVMINAGVFVLPKQYRTSSAYKQLMSIADRYHNYVAYADQSLISIWALKEQLPISKNIYDNFQLVFLFDKRITFDGSKITILHFTGDTKFDDKYSEKFFGVHRAILDQANKIRAHYRVVRNNNEQVLMHLGEIQNLVSSIK